MLCMLAEYVCGVLNVVCQLLVAIQWFFCFGVLVQMEYLIDVNIVWILFTLILNAKGIANEKIRGGKCFNLGVGIYQFKKKKKKERKSTRLNSSPGIPPRMPASA
eukprot:TRINITY_DN5544_c1_g1_i1.p3 TRINITY_DN5544_c1_g1~~TRINITY_DN5544_c1_g1_i1.p3  ORF type:complete len:105 (-),score=12.61 TRINITY_DN5544_c1_g1_i1:10-324(-)